MYWNAVLQPHHWLTPKQFSGEFRRLWASTTNGFRKLECEPVFLEDGDPGFECFVVGKRSEAQRLVRERVLTQKNTYADLLSRGATINRLRVIGRPMTSYIADYELAAYEAAAEIGEQVNYIAEEAIPEHLRSVCRDWLMFDEQAVLLHEYTPWGRMTGGWLVTDPGVVAVCAAAWHDLDTLKSEHPPRCS